MDIGLFTEYSFSCSDLQRSNTTERLLLHLFLFNHSSCRGLLLHVITHDTIQLSRYNDSLLAGQTGIEFRWGLNSPHPCRPALGPTHPSVQWVSGLSSRGKQAGNDVNNTPYLAPRLKK
jgi:hypothetical protein